MTDVIICPDNSQLFTNEDGLGDYYHHHHTGSFKQSVLLETHFNNILILNFPLVKVVSQPTLSSDGGAQSHR